MAGAGGDLGRGDTGVEPLLNAAPSEPARSDASLRWPVAPEPAPLTADTRNGACVGLTDVAVIKSTGDTFAMLDDRFRGEHARHAVVQYLSHDVAPLRPRPLCQQRRSCPVLHGR